MCYLNFLLFSILILFCVEITATFYNKVICDVNQTITYDKEGIIFIESLNFPLGATEACNITFNYENQKNFRTMIVITNCNDLTIFPRCGMTLYSKNSRISWGNYNFALTSTTYNKTSLTLSVSANNPFQGYIVTDSWADGCPLMSLTAENSFTFTDDSQILYLSSSYDGIAQIGDSSRIRCRWRFVSPKLYKFKLVYVSGINEDTSLVLNYGVSRNMTLKDENAILYTSYLLDGNVLNIFYDDPPSANISNPLLDSRTSLSAFLTVVKINKHKTQAACKTYKSGPTTTIWELKDGYPNNARCSFTMPLPVDKEIKVNLKNIGLERNNDIIRFYFDGKYTIYYRTLNYSTTPLFANYDYAFRAQESGYNKNVTFEFISDGSIQRQGFSMVFEEGEKCKCNNQKSVIAPCLGTYVFGIMSKSNENYCGDLACNFTVNIYRFPLR